MKLFAFAALTALCAVVESATALPLPSDYRGGGGAAAKLQTRKSSSSSHRSSSAASKPPTTPLTSRPSTPHSDPGSAGSFYETAPSSPVASTHTYPPSSVGKPLPNLPEGAEGAVPPPQHGPQSSAHTPPTNAPPNTAGGHSQAAQGGSESSQGTGQTSPSNSNTGQAPAGGGRVPTQHETNVFNQAETQNAVLNKHNSVMQNLGKVGATIAGAGLVGAVGFGINSAVETHNKNQFDEQQAEKTANQTAQAPANQTAQAPAQQTAQPAARRAIIDGEVYELYWVK